MTDGWAECEVVVAGGGPTGLMLACELALAGARTVVLERLRERPGFCRGFNLNARGVQLLDRRGLAIGGLRRRTGRARRDHKAGSFLLY